MIFVRKRSESMHTSNCLDSYCVCSEPTVPRGTIAVLLSVDDWHPKGAASVYRIATFLVDGSFLNDIYERGEIERDWDPWDV